MRLVPPPPTPCRRQGVALVIVLTFVVLLTGVALAFFSRAISERQISNGSAGEVRADLFAQGAADSIIGDLRQEVAAGSKVVTPATDVTVYVPKPASAGVASTAVPALVGFTPQYDATTKLEIDGLNNLVKRSARGQAFFSGANYDTANYPAPTRAAAVSSGPDDATTGGYASLNGRYISAERWNKPLLLAKKTPDDETLTPVTGFRSPDWVLVARDGTNPTAWNATLVTSNNTATSVVGRYAYNVYDEGGLLDANVAGYPSTSTAAQSGYKSAVAYADLTQLTDASGSQLLTPAQVDAVVGWRNYASTQAPAAFPAPGFTTLSATNYFKFVLGGTQGFLTTGSAKLYGGQSDRMFATRQELMKLLLQGVATDSTSRIKLQNALQYLGTFSRGLEQPSFIRTQSVDSTDPLGYDSTAPKLLDPKIGGNNAGPSGGSGGLDAAINPSFPAVRVKTAKPNGRFDGSDLVVGEPLVKKRFALSRLAWLTFAGPLCADGNNYNSAVGVSQVVTALKDNYGFTDSFLKQGTTANIQNYFGLSWDASNNRWNYVHNQGGSAGKAICKLSYASDQTDVLRAGREADFFELLKASVNVGSLGKVGTVSDTDTNAAKLITSQISQYKDDSRVDDAIIQMGANIIDQFDLDGYSTQIYFNDGGATAGGKTFHGVENLPYLAGLKHALVRVKQAEPTLIGSGIAATITNTGVGALLQCPEVWNPHDYNTASASQIDQTAGVVGPTKFRVYAESGTAGVNNVIQFLGILRDQNSSPNLGHNHAQSTVASVARSPGYESLYHFTFTNPEPISLTRPNTELDFTVSRDAAGLARFREPTLLYKLASDGGYVDASPQVSSLGIIGSNNTFFVGNSFRSDADSGVSGVPPVRGKGYVGFYLGAVPLYWYDAQQAATAAPCWVDNLTPKSSVEMHYYLQYEYPADSGQYVTYDEKYRTLGGGGSENSTVCGGGARSAATNGWESFLYPRVTGKTNNWDTAYAAMDPRSSRFGLMKLVAGKSDASWWTYPPSYNPAANGDGTRPAGINPVSFNAGWIDVAKGIGLTLRSGTSDGTPMYCATGVFPTTMGWNPGSPVAATTSGRYSSYDNTSGTLGATNGSHVFHPGLMAQNNPFARRNNRAMGDSGDPATMDTAFLPSSPSNAAQFYTDADAVIRRASGGLVPYTVGNGPTATTNTGLPGTPANTGGMTRFSQSDSRPMVLNRPFRTVAELGYTFSGTPWKNLSFNMPESPDAALLDVFCVNASDDANGLVAGKVSLNTRQAPVLQAILAGAYKDEWDPTNTANGALAGGANGMAVKIAAALVKRTTAGPAAGLNAGKPQPLTNVSELVGKWVQNVPGNDANGVSGNATTADAPNTAVINPRSYDGFSSDLIDNRYTATGDGVLVAPTPDTNATISRFANASVRALSAAGQTRVWNLLIDVVAQTGRYPQTAASLDKFNVEGEQRYWVHVAIDRLTGQVLDKQVEVVKE